MITFLRADLDGSLMSKKKSFVFDLDGIINHGDMIPHGLVIKGSVKNSHIDPHVLEMLALISQRIDLFVNTARSEAYVQDFMQHFMEYKVPVKAWILEHGAVVLNRPEWTKTVLKGMDLEQIHEQICRVVLDRKIPIDLNRYYHEHRGFLLYSGAGELLAEHFISSVQGVLKDRFRVLVGKRKIAIIPRCADKYLAFFHNFGQSHELSFAAGDSIDDLTLLQHACFPLTLAGASQIVQDYVNDRGGYVSSAIGHAGINQLLAMVHETLVNSGVTSRDLVNPGVAPGNPVNTNLLPAHCMPDVPGPALPVEQMDTFRPSRVAYLKLLFKNSVDFKGEPDLQFIGKIAGDLNLGRNIILEVAMRDWGGEVKALRALLNAFIQVLPFSRWRLKFRQERLGTENLNCFDAITRKLEKYLYLPDGTIRFSAPGVPQSPLFEGRCHARILLFDHPGDLKQWYDLAMPRLITRHPEITDTWFVNPMFLKISDPEEETQKRGAPLFPASKVMMAANIVDQTDIDIAVSGYESLKPHVDTLIIAPRVITNKKRNNLIKDAVKHLNTCCYSTLKKNDTPEVVIVDTYGDLSGLYCNSVITYLGGGFDHRKRGFDPMESLFDHVPVILGPMYDFNRIVVQELRNTGWIHVLKSQKTALGEFTRHGRGTVANPPDITSLNCFMEKRAHDPMRIVMEIVAGMANICSNGYIIQENSLFPADTINPNSLICENN